jgi:uncharacterized membrane protein YqgA involved in biofilm formation
LHGQVIEKGSRGSYNQADKAGKPYRILISDQGEFIMPGLGTIVNAAAVVAAGFLGLLLGSRIKKNVQETIIIAMGVATLILAVAGTLSKMLVVQEDGTLAVQGTMTMIISLAVGSVIGELLDLDGKVNKFGSWLKIKSGNAKDEGFVEAFVTSSLTICIGAMAVVGAIQDGISADHSILFAKSVLDFLIIVVLSAAMGKGCIFSAIPIVLLEGSMTLLGVVIKPLLTAQALNNLSLVGNAIIVCVGINLIWDRKIRVANMLPALILAVAMAFLPFNLS